MTNEGQGTAGAVSTRHSKQEISDISAGAKVYLETLVSGLKSEIF